MLVRTLSKHNFTLFYFDCHGTYGDLVDAIKTYIDAGPTEKELFYFDADAQFITPDQVKKIVPVASKAAEVRPAGGQTALLYGRVSLYGLGRIYKVVESKIVKKNWSTEVFKDFDRATGWLDISSEIVTNMIAQHNLTQAQKPFPYTRE